MADTEPERTFMWNGLRHKSANRFVSAVVRTLPVTGGMLVASRVLISSVAYAQGGQLELTRIDFVREYRAAGQEAQIRERGSYFVAPDGNYRLEQAVDGERYTEIVKPIENKRIVLDADTKRAVVGSLSQVWSAPSTHSKPVPVPSVPSRATRHSQNMARIGTKTVEGLTLEGTRDTTVMVDSAGGSVLHTTELWAYRPADARVLPMILEIRVETPDGIDERRITSVSTFRASGELFEIPVGFSVANLGR